MTTVRKVRGMEVAISERDRIQILTGMEEILEKGWLMWGDWQEKLQDQFKQRTGRKHAVTFNSATSALEVLFRWLTVTKGSERIAMQANCFPSPAFAAERAGMEVVWCDIEPSLLCPSVQQLDELHQRTDFDVLLIQWTGGFMSSEVAEVMAWAGERHVFVVEDASHSAGSSDRLNVPAGNQGHAAVFSLAATKPLQTAQGGMLLTDDEAVATYAFQMKNYGRTEMFQKGVYVQSGFNMHMTEIQAVVGAVLIESMDAAVAWRHRLATIMRSYVEQTTASVLGCWEGRPNLYKMVVWLPVGVDKAQLKETFAAKDIEMGSSLYDFVTPELPMFNGGEAFGTRFPKTTEYVASHVCLPLHNAMTLEDAERVGTEFVAALA